ncbi:hypothetical protein HYU23_02690 [Candidatus Woesearchaeota archaeon]|nr:hypothetical protein [Candidatus Woesearchaeota archaeon]
MEKSSAQTVVKVISILYWIGAGLGAIGGLLMLFGGSAIGMTGFASISGLFGGLFAAMGIVMIAFAVLGFFVGLGLWRNRNWARITAIVLGVIGLLSFPIGTIINAIIIYFLAFNKDVKNLFR